MLSNCVKEVVKLFYGHHLCMAPVQPRHPVHEFAVEAIVNVLVANAAVGKSGASGFLCGALRWAPVLHPSSNSCARPLEPERRWRRCIGACWRSRSTWQHAARVATLRAQGTLPDARQAGGVAHPIQLWETTMLGKKSKPA